MCFDTDSTPPIPAIKGAAVSHDDLVLRAADGNELAAFLAAPDEPATAGIVIWAGVRYDNFTCFQGRLIFPAFLSGLLLLAEGFDGVVGRWTGARRWLNPMLAASYVVFGVYFAVEVASVLAGSA